MLDRLFGDFSGLRAKTKCQSEVAWWLTLICLHKNALRPGRVTS